MFEGAKDDIPLINDEDSSKKTTVNSNKNVKKAKQSLTNESNDNQLIDGLIDEKVVINYGEINNENSQVELKQESVVADDIKDGKIENKSLTQGSQTAVETDKPKIDYGAVISKAKAQYKDYKVMLNGIFDQHFASSPMFKLGFNGVICEFERYMQALFITNCFNDQVNEYQAQFISSVFDSGNIYDNTENLSQLMQKCNATLAKNPIALFMTVAEDKLYNKDFTSRLIGGMYEIYVIFTSLQQNNLVKDKNDLFKQLISFAKLQGVNI